MFNTTIIGCIKQTRLFWSTDKIHTIINEAMTTKNTKIISSILQVNGEQDYRNKQGKQLLHLAAEHNHVKAVDLLLAKNVDVTFDNQNNTAASLAAINGNDVILKTLIEKNSHLLNQLNASNQTPLILASWKGHKACVDYLILKKANLNILSNNRTALAMAIDSNYVEIARALINNGADIHAGGKKHTPLYLAIKENCWEMMFYLKELGARITSDPYPLLREAIEKNQKQKVQFLISTGLTIQCQNERGESLLHDFSRNNKITAVDLLLEIGIDVMVIDGRLNTAAMYADRKDCKILNKLVTRNPELCNKPDQDNNTLLILAAEQEQIQAVKCILSVSANLNHINNKGRTALGLAIFKRNIAITQLLIDAGADFHVGKKNNTAIDLAVQSHCWMIIPLLMKKLSQQTKMTEQQVSNMQVLLIEAIARDKVHIVEQWIELALEVSIKALLSCDNKKILPILKKAKNLQNPDFFKQNFEEMSTLFYRVIENNDMELAKFLMDKGADINRIDEHKGSPLCCAIKGDNQVAIKLLLANGANAVVIDNQQNTAIMMAAITGSYDILNQLIKNPDLKTTLNKINKKGYTVLDLAIQKNQIEIVKLLINAGTNIDTNNGRGNPPLVEERVKISVDPQTPFFKPVQETRNSEADGGIKRIREFNNENTSKKARIDTRENSSYQNNQS